MARLEHRMDLMLERFAHQDKRLDDLITTVNVRFDDFGQAINNRFGDFGQTINTQFDDVHRWLDDLGNHLIRFQSSIENRVSSVGNHLMSLGAQLEGKASSWAIGVWVSVAIVWVTLAVGVSTAILSYR
jgi:hypothetical protein